MQATREYRSVDSVDDDAFSSQDSSLNKRAASLFNLLDPDGSGFIEQDALTECCGNLTSGEISTIFNELDSDGDGKINLQDFQEGFKAIGMKMAEKEREDRERLGSISSQLKAYSQERLLDFDGHDDSALQTPACEHLRMEEGLEYLTCHEQVCELYKTLQNENPHLLGSFESIILQVVQDVDQQKKERARLEASFKKEKEDNEKYLKQLEEDMEIQFSKMEIRIRGRERKKLEAEYEQMVKGKMTEIETLQHTIQSLQSKSKQNKHQMDSTDVNLKSKIDDFQHENMKLQSDLQLLETSLAISKSELVSMKNDHDVKCSELENEKRSLMEYVKEQDKLTHQLQLLHDANRKLHDTNDDLRAALENRHLQSPSSGRGTLTRNTSVASERISVCDPIFNQREVLLPAHDTCEEDNPEMYQEDIDHDPDSGTSTFRDPPDDFPDHFILPCTGMRKCLTQETRLIDYNANLNDSDFDDLDQLPDQRRRRNSLQRPTSLNFRRGYDSSSDSDNSYEVIGRRGRRPKSSRSSNKSRSNATTPYDFSSPASYGPPERMFKIVLAGDAAVGKSSFIMRFCEGRFCGNLVSTLGVDFKTKTLEVDGHVIAIQLWDTAGQERFRSIAKSYFRRADGVILMYDCTYEKSFLNVREWIESIEDCAEQGTPLLLVANKVDMRPEARSGGVSVVSTEAGRKIAQQNNALFIEVSSKTGFHIQEAIIELTRLLRTQEDLAVNNIKLNLHETQGKKSTCCSFVP